MPVILVSKVSFTIGARRVCRALPNARPSAEVGHTSMHLACPTQRSACSRIAFPFTRASVPVSGQASTQLPHPMHNVALMTGRGFPFSADAAPLTGSWTAARCTFHSDMGAPQDGQNVDSFKIGLPQRGHAIVAFAVCAAAAGGAACPAAAPRFGVASVFRYRRRKKNVTTEATRNVISVSIPLNLSQKYPINTATVT